MINVYFGLVRGTKSAFGNKISGTIYDFTFREMI